LSVAVLRDAQGTPLGFIGVSRDITARKLAEERQQQLYRQEKELRQQLEDEMKRRVEFTRALAHELKTPLTPMLISSQALTSNLKDELLLSFAININRGALNLNSRIDELLDLAKGEIGMLQLKSEPLDVLQLLHEAIEYVSPVALNREQTLVAEIPPALPEVKADKVRLRQIVLNLLNNALKYTRERGKITLRAGQREGGLIVEVEDNGPGIDEKEQEHLFEPYHRMEVGEERLSGLGLGLALCKTLVELHGGKIWVRSQLGKGSIFSFSIPLE
jgi:two-component system aerobic respiration control sensor histidine kinase ArcB